MKGRRLWMRISCYASSVPAYIVEELVDEDGNVLDGQYDPEKHQILIRRTDESQMKRRLWHEIKHIPFSMSTGDALRGILNGNTSDARTAHEERIVGFQAPDEYTILAENGFLRFPKPPKARG